MNAALRYRGRRGVVVDSHRHGPDFKTAAHRHCRHSLLYIVSGSGRCVVDNASLDVASNTAVVLKAGQRHQLIDSPGRAMTVFVVYFNEAVADANEGILGPVVTLHRAIAVPPHTAQRIKRALRQMLHEQDTQPPKFDQAIQQCLASIILELYRVCRGRAGDAADCGGVSSERRVQEVLRFVRDHYYERQSLAGAARMAGLSQRQFTNICRRLTSRSFVQYVNQLRVDRAVGLLEDSDMPVSAIAFEVGFEDLSTFYRAFRRLCQVAPLAYRQAHRRK